MDHIIDVEFDDLHCTLTLPDYIPLESVMDLCEYLTPPLRLFKPFTRPGNRIGFILPGLLDQARQEHFVKMLMAHCSCWFRCYPGKVEQKRQELLSLGKRLKVVETPI